MFTPHRSSPPPPCHAPDKASLWSLTGQVAGQDNMMAEIAARGPISCGICVTPEFEAYAGGIYNDSRQCTEEMHVIAVEGYGEERGVPFWLARNRSACLHTAF